MKKLTFMCCAAAVAVCLAGAPQSLAQQPRDQEQQDEDRQTTEDQEQDEQAQERKRQQEQQRQERERQQRQREQQQQQQDQRERETERNRQQQDQQGQRQQRESQFDQGYQRDQDQRFGQDQRFQDDQQSGQDQRFDAQFQGRSQQQLQLGARFEDSGDRLVIADIRDQSLLAQAGLRAQDVIVSVDGRPVRTQDQFQQLLVRSQGRGAEIPVIILRDGQRQTVYLDVDRWWRDTRRFPRDDFYGGQEAWLGVILDPRYEDYTVVRRVYPGSAADEAGIREGDWIIGINNRRVQSPAHLSQLVDTMRPGERVDIQVARRVTRTLEAQLGSMGDRGERGFTRTQQGRFQDGSDQRFQSEFQTEDEFRSGYRGVDEQDVFQEEGVRQQRFNQRRGVLRDRFNPNEERGLRDRLDRDQARDRLFDNNRDQ